MKRHPSLVPLSRDHHHGLVMAQRLILGRSTNPRADWPADRARQAVRLIDFFETDLRPHFEAEEAHVFPAASGSLAEGADPTRALIAEHETMRAMIRDLVADPTSALEERLTAFGELLRAHIHTEERILFEQMQAACDEEVLETLGARIAEHGRDARGARCSL
jgi:hemerythrin-like domain-containing protein